MDPPMSTAPLPVVGEMLMVPVPVGRISKVELDPDETSVTLAVEFAINTSP